MLRTQGREPACREAQPAGGRLGGGRGAAGRALSTTPAVEAVACVVVRARESSDRPWESIYVGTFERAYAERLLVEGRWSADPEALAKAVVEADDVDLELTGRTREIVALELSVDPGLMAV